MGLGDQFVRGLRCATGAVWQWLRGAAGEHAYPSYLHHAQKHGDQPLTAKEFYLENIQRKYKRPNRCC